MAQGFVINALLNASRFIRGVKDMDDALDDLEGALEDAQDEVDRLDRDGEKAFDSLADGAEEAADEANSLEKRLRDVRDATKDAGKAGDDAGDDMRRGFKRAEDGISEFKDEANSTAREAAASFDGSAESIGDAFQEVAANAFAGFGPAGAVAGIAAAAGIGAAVAGFEAVDEANRASQERIDEWVDKFIEGSGRVQEEAVLTGVQNMFGDPEEMKRVTEIIAATGLEQSTVMRALAGDIEDNRLVSEGLTAARDELTEAQKRNLDNFRPMNEGLQAESQELLKAEDGWRKHNGELDKATSQYSVFSDALSAGLIRMAETQVAAGEASKAVDEFGDTVYTLPDGKNVYVDAETGQATQDIEEFERIDIDTKHVNVKVGIDTSAYDNWRPPAKSATAYIYGRQAV